MIASTDFLSPAVLLFRAEGDELALKESFPVEESVFNVARSGDGATAAIQVRMEGLYRRYVSHHTVRHVKLFPNSSDMLTTKFPSRFHFQ